MFVCEECYIQQRGIEDFRRNWDWRSKSYGRCEVCGYTGVCVDVYNIEKAT